MLSLMLNVTGESNMAGEGITRKVRILKRALKKTGFPEDNTSMAELEAVVRAHIARLCDECEGHGSVVLKGKLRKCKICDGTGRKK